MTSVDRRPYLAVTLDSTPIEAIGARVQQGYLLNYACAEVDVRTLPAGLAPWGIVQITMGGTLATAAVRFTGYFVSHEANLWENSYKLNCRGYLYRAELYCATVDVNMAWHEPVGGVQLWGFKDETHVSVALFICGLLTSKDDWVADADPDIGGTGYIMGKHSRGTGFDWHEGNTALSFIQRLDAVCLGYRTFDTADGTIVRQQITATPGTASLTFTEGIDIYRASATDTVIEAKNKIVVEGYNRSGKSATALRYEATGSNSWLYLPTSEGLQQWYVTYQLSSPMIEQQDTPAGTDDGISCQQVAEWLLSEMNTRRISVQFTTPRDDLISPGDTIAVDSATRMGIDQDFWVQQVDTSLSASGFSQVLTCIAPYAEPPS